MSIVLHMLCTTLKCLDVCTQISLLALTALFGEFKVTTDPESGSVITAFEYQNHIVIQCRISEGGDLLNTIWTAYTASDLDGV